MTRSMSSACRKIRSRCAPNRGQSMARRNPCSECPVRTRALCCALTAEQLAAFNRISYGKHCPAGRLISDVDQEERFANVISGVVKLTRALADGRHVGLLFPSDFLGLPFRAGGGCTAEADEGRPTLRAGWQLALLSHLDRFERHLSAARACAR